MTGLQRVARRAILARLKASLTVRALVPVAAIHSQQVPAGPSWPFIKLGVPQTLPMTAACLNGAVITIPVDAFARQREEGGLVVETAEDHASRIGAAIERALHLRGETVTVEGQSVRLSYSLSDMRLFPDGEEADAFHYSGLIRAKVLAA
jgi:hypothetical protein